MATCWDIAASICAVDFEFELSVLVKYSDDIMVVTCLVLSLSGSVYSISTALAMSAFSSHEMVRESSIILPELNMWETVESALSMKTPYFVPRGIMAPRPIDAIRCISALKLEPLTPVI